MFIILMIVLIIIPTILIIFHSVPLLAHRSHMPVAPCPSASAMIAATVRKVYKYMSVAVEHDNSNWKSVTDNQFSHLMSTIRRAKVDSDDSTQALAALKGTVPLPRLPAESSSCCGHRGYRLVEERAW
jgi:hypothetical protein